MREREIMYITVQELNSAEAISLGSTVLFYY